VAIIGIVAENKATIASGRRLGLKLWCLTGKTPHVFHIAVVVVNVVLIRWLDLMGRCKTRENGAIFLGAQANETRTRWSAGSNVAHYRVCCAPVQVRALACR
jgi:hypothetical protein